MRRTSGWIDSPTRRRSDNERAPPAGAPSDVRFGLAPLLELIDDFRGPSPRGFAIAGGGAVGGFVGGLDGGLVEPAGARDSFSDVHLQGLAPVAHEDLQPDVVIHVGLQAQ